MKKNYRITTIASGKMYQAAVMAVLLLSVLYAGTSVAQGNRRGGERRNDVAIDRANNGNRRNNNEPGINRNRNYDPGNNNRGRNDNAGNINRGNEEMRNRGRSDNRWNSNRGNDEMRNRGRDNPGNNNRGGNDTRIRDRRGNDNITGRGNDYRRNIYTRDRPGYRPVYGYDRRPVYNRYDPCWRYNFLPRRNSYFYSVPSTYFSISFGGFSYRYWDGVFYRPYNNLFTVCAPPVGIFINILPVGYRRIYVHDYPYYYYNGTFYDQRGSNYYVVSPPLGAIVESIPDGYDTVVIDGETYYVVDGAQYKPVVVENGEIWYEVIKAN